MSPEPPNPAVNGGLLRKALTCTVCPTPMGLGAALISRNVGISIALAALAAGKKDASVIDTDNTRIKEIAVISLVF
jgi:hypothetical protein